MYLFNFLIYIFKAAYCLFFHQQGLIYSPNLSKSKTVLSVMATTNISCEGIANSCKEMSKVSVSSLLELKHSVDKLISRSTED